MSTSADRVARAILGSVWAIHERKLEEIVGFVDAFRSGERMSAEEARERFGATRSTAVRSSGQIAVLPIYGTITPRAGLLSAYSGGTDCREFSRMLAEVVENDDVDAIVLDVDSPGGSVAGIAELADQIRRARGRKPIHAVSNYQMASAAYWLGSQADEVIASPSSELGSIGVYMIHTDISEAADKAGVKHTVIRAGRYKAEGLPYEPLTEVAHEALQAECDEFYDMFVADVAKGRDVKAADVRSGFGEGRCLSARGAVRAGLADRVATLDEVIDGLRGQRAKPRNGRATSGAQVSTISAVGGSVSLFYEASPVVIQAPAPAATSEEGPGYRLVPVAEEARACPECGSEMEQDEDGTWHCPECGHSDEETEANGRDAGGAAPGAESTTPDRSASKAREEPMSNNVDTAPAPAGAQTLDQAAILTAERERVRQIRGMVAEHGIDEVRAAEWISAGHSADHVARLVLDEVRARNANAPAVAVGADRATERPWSSFGEQLQAIAQSVIPGGSTDPRLHAAASGSNATVGAEGGFLIQKDFSTEIYEKAYETGVLASRCDQVEIGANSDGLEVPFVDETSRANGSRWGGVQVYRRAEAATVAATKPNLGKFEVRLEDLMGISYATGRLLQDATALESVMTRAFSSEFAFRVDDEIFRGTGVGECLGIINSPAFVKTAKESGQANKTVVAENVQKMWARMWARSRTTAIWLYNQEIEPQLQSMQIGTGASAQLVFLPPGGLSGAQYATIYGRPAFAIEQAAALGDVGDISVVDLNEYALIRKGGLQQDESMHVRFLYDEMAFRFIMRVNGKPKWHAPLTPYKGTDTLSPFVGLAAR